jgi:hypothetical protein
MDAFDGNKKLAALYGIQGLPATKVRSVLSPDLWQAHSPFSLVKPCALACSPALTAFVAPLPAFVDPHPH